MNNGIGQLTDADEQLVHQYQGTLATVSTTDPAWTERVYGWAADTSGDIAVAFGLSKYPNRNVMDAYGIVTAGTTQYNVRASRQLFPEPHTTQVGPLRYEVSEPLQTVRCILEPNDVQPIAFDVTLHATVFPFTEHHVVKRHYRRVDDVSRYLQLGEASGVVELQGQQFHFTPSESLTARDHSWGIRSGVGRPEREGQGSADIKPGSKFRMIWSPGRLMGAEGVTHIHFSHWDARSRRGYQEQDMTSIVLPNGEVARPTRVEWVPEIDSGGVITSVRCVCHFDGGNRRVFLIEPFGASRLFLGPGLYAGFRGKYHGEDRGLLHLEGEVINDTLDPEGAAELHQLSQEIARITDLDTGAVGWCAFQYELVGEFPEYNNFERSYR